MSKEDARFIVLYYLEESDMTLRIIPWLRWAYEPDGAPLAFEKGLWYYTDTLDAV